MLNYCTELHRMLEGLAAYLPLPPDLRQAEMLASALGVDEEIDDDTVLVISTSGTTGTPKGAQHTAETLTASAAATHEFLGGEGNWLLALPPHHIAGLQVLLRALGSGHIPVVLDLASGFDPAALVTAIDELDGPRRYTSLVPTQLVKALESPDAVAALKELDAILIGGAATPIPLQARAREAGLPIIRTYGMSETAGGCVYGGIPLPGVDIRIDEPDSEGTGRVVLGGPMVAHGYRNLPGHHAFAEAGYFRTDDLGTLSPDGVLSIIGRADEAITSGGLTIVPQVVEAVILDDPAVAECAVVGVPDDRLGQRVVAFVVAAGAGAAGSAGAGAGGAGADGAGADGAGAAGAGAGAASAGAGAASAGAASAGADGAGAASAGSVDAQRIMASVAERLDRYAAPREVLIVDALPLRGPGKVDRQALRARLVD